MSIMSRVKTLGAVFGMLLLILDSPTVFRGAGEGLELCLKTVIPSLFPFFVLSSLIAPMPGTNSSRGWGRALGLPRGSEGIFLTGILGGYPIGARSIGEAVRLRRLDGSDGARMMSFCNNPGPAFIFGIAGSMFDVPWTGWILWSIQVAGALAVALLLPGSEGKPMEPIRGTPPTLPEAMNRSLQAMAGVCGWVVLFRVVLAFLDRWFLWLLPASCRVILCGLLELTNGCCMLTEIPNQGLRFVICSGLLSFGGACVGMQTASAARGVSLRWYLPGKILHGLISSGLAVTLQGLIFPDSSTAISPLVLPGVLMTAGVMVFFRGKIKNRSGISEAVGV